mgnify:CR=1 FL=1
MNVYEKLVEARVRFQSSNVKKSGQNKFAGYSYYELADILPVINSLSKELKFAVVVYFEDATWKLDFIDSEKIEDKITFTFPHSTAQLKGCHEVQNVGAVNTYSKRYLYQNAFEIVEADAIDATMNPNDQKQQSKQAPREQAPRQAPKEVEPDYKALGKKLSEKLGLVPEEKDILWDVAGKNLKEMYILLTMVETEGSSDAGIIAYEQQRRNK